MHVFYGIAKTIMDGTKDADQQYDFAMQAKADGKPEIAAKHIEEAKKRLAGVKEWYDIGVKLLAAEKSEPLVDAVMELLMQHHRASLDKIAQFKPGA
jgi:hypothetical protein